MSETKGASKRGSNAATATATADPAQSRFVEGEKVLCFHGPLIYEAKIQKVGPRPKGSSSETGPVKYFIHYHGWNKNWDEWVINIS